MNWMTNLLSMAGAADGWKTYAAAIATIMVGVVGIVMWFIDAESDQAIEPTIAVGMITLGLSMLGLGHKGAKLDNKLDQINLNTEFVARHEAFRQDNP